ncbi:MAG: T9SS type A sorting domain-containing protein [Bacteroidota bacterium]
MKKLYMIGVFSAIAATSFAQWNAQNSPNRKTFTRSEVSPMVSRHAEFTGMNWENRVTLLSEDFQAVSGAMPAALPSGWSTNQVTQQDGTLGNAFKTHNSTTANAGGYWPVPNIAGNKFAGANDDNVPCDCAMDDVYVQSPTLDFSAASNIVVSFDIFHDMNFGGGDATLQVSTDGGTTWNIVPIGVDATGANIDVFPMDQDFWQSLIVPVYNLSGQASVTFRWQWTDNGSWASGFAVDNVVIGELPAYDVRVSKTKVGDWNQATFGLGFWDYNRVPLTQVSPVKATTVIFNGGSNDQVDATVNYDVTFNGTAVAGSPFAGAQTSANFLSLDKDTISVATTYTPSALGTVQINATATSTSGDDDLTNNAGSATIEITQFEYGRDFNAAQAFFGPTTDFEFGNLFDIYADDDFGAIDVAIGAGSTAGDPIIGRIYLFEGFDAATGDPVFTDLGLETMEYTIQDADLNSVGEANFVHLTFATPVTLNADNVYLAVASCVANTRIPVSGSNEWVTSWFFDGTWGATLSIPMVRLNSDETLAVNNLSAAGSAFELGQNIPNPSNGNTTITYNLPSNERVTLTVRDLTGRVVNVINEGVRPAGKNMLTINTNALGAGIYTYTLTAGTNSLTKKMTVK